MSFLFESYECKVDAKGRLPIPSGLKKDLIEVMADGFVLKRSVFKNCLELHVMKDFMKIMDEIGKLNRFNAKNNDFVRIFTAGLKKVEVDGNGRLQISKDLIAFANIDKDVVLNAVGGGVIEIWDKTKYEETIEISQEDFAKLAEEVMGNIENTGKSTE